VRFTDHLKFSQKILPQGGECTYAAFDFHIFLIFLLCITLLTQELANAGHGKITTEIKQATEFYYAEEYHQQYLAKNPGGYCGMGGTGVSCPIGLGKSSGKSEL